MKFKVSFVVEEDSAKERPAYCTTLKEYLSRAGIIAILESDVFKYEKVTNFEFEEIKNDTNA